MSKLTWNDAAKKRFERGVSKVVVYVNATGYAFPGVTSINESNTGGNPKPYYQDGIKYLNIASAEEYAATLNSYTVIDEFLACDGTVSVSNGLYVTEQPRSKFDMVYETNIGAEANPSLGKKIHIVYNLLASPTQHQHNSIAESAAIEMYSWGLTSIPVSVSGRRPTSHFIVDSIASNTVTLALLEAYIYGLSLIHI